MSFIQNLFSSRDNNADGASYVGQTGRLWWNPDTNSLYYSDGTTPGGIAVGSGGNPFNQLLNTYNSVTFANVNVTGTITGNLTGNANVTDLTVTGNVNFSTTGNIDLGNLVIFDQTIAGTIADRDISLSPNGNGTLRTLNGIGVYQGSYSTQALFTISGDGVVSTLVPNSISYTSGFEIVGNPTGTSVTPQNYGTMLHITGLPTVAARIYNDGVANYATFINRRYNGTSDAPTPVLNNQIMGRLGSTPFLDNGGDGEWPALSTTRLDFVTTEDQTTTQQGSKMQFYTVANGETTPTLTMELDIDTGIKMYGDILPSLNNTFGLGNITQKWSNVWIGPSSLFLEDSVLGGDSEVHVDNSVFFIDGVTAAQVGNMQMTTNGLRLTTAGTGNNIQIGENSDTGYVEVNMLGIEFKDGTRQTTAAIPLTQKGAASGVVPLNSSTKIDPIYLPSGAITFKGVWDAANNTPTLADGVGANGDEYIVGVAGTQNLGSGSITFSVGDFVLYTAANVWVDIPVGGAGVDSFNGRTGIVTLISGDVTNALSNGSITNNYLSNDSWSLTVGQGIGLTGNATVELGDSISLTNTGVTAAIAGTGVAVSAATGNVTFSIGQAVGTANSVQFSAITSTTTVAATGNITGGNISTGGRIIATGNITGGNIITASGTVLNNGLDTTGNVVTTAYFIGNGSLLTGLNAYGNVYANGTAMVAGNGSATLSVTPGNNQVITGNATSKVLTIAVNDNPTFANITVTGNIFTANTSYLSNIGNILFANSAPLPTAQPGIMEYDGRILYFTPQDQERGVVPNQQWYVLNADRGLTFGTTTAQSLFGVGAHVSNGTRYWFRIKATVSRATGTNNTALTLGWQGDAVLSKLSYTVQSSIGTTGTAKALYMYENVLISNFTNQATVTTTNNPPDSTDMVITGIMDVGPTGAGTVNPYITWTGGTAAGSVTVSSLSNYQIYPLGVTGASTSVGNWS